MVLADFRLETRLLIFPLNFPHCLGTRRIIRYQKYSFLNYVFSPGSLFSIYVRPNQSSPSVKAHR